MNRVHQALTPYRVFIVDDHRLVRRALRAVLAFEPTVEVVGEAASAEEALACLDGHKPDISLVDFSLPGMNGTALIRQLSRTHPSMACLMVSSHHEQLYVSAALAAGARGYVLKGDSDILVRAITGVLRGEIVVETDWGDEHGI